MAGTEESIRLLIAEDSEDDALLLVRELRRGGYAPEMRRVDSAAAMQAALEEQLWDLIITDHNMPGFDSQEALTLARQHGRDIPFIVVSGSIGEEVAVDAMKSGAHDYVMKNNLTRLLPAIERELREAENRRAHQAAEATIRHLAYHDSLTGLVNRAEFELRLGTAVAGAREAGETHALLYVDLDQFKLVNDTCGHLAGDELLRRIARRLQRGIRESDTLARLGGDEFGVLLKNCPLERAQRIAQGMLDSIKAYRFVWEQRTFNAGASIGLVLVGDAEEDAPTLLSLADMACYAAKDRGRNRMHIYSEGDKELSLRRGEMQWIQRLHAAMANQGLMLYRQRIQALQGGVSHNELLLRMQGEKGEVITPGQFIPAAERYNLMPEIDRWVIRSACEQLQLLHQFNPQTDAVATFINLSATSLSDDGLMGYIRDKLQHHRIPPASVGFEITETAAIADFDCARTLIKALRECGCRVALDDFGTGMSSFAYLKSLEVDFIKIDGSFVCTMLEDQMDGAIVEAVNSIGHIAGIQTIAEFVESDAILQKLSALGVDFAQGWAVEQPQPFTALRKDLTAKG